MRKVIATFGTGPAAQTLALALPGMLRYAARHDYEVLIGTGQSQGRPPAWGKIPLIRALLDSHDFVLWLDSDVLVLDDTLDLQGQMGEQDYQALVLTPTPGGGVSPCTGVWAFRRDPRSSSFLDAVWSLDQFVDDHPWEQAAAAHLLGYSNTWPPEKVGSTEWESGVAYVAEEWDMLPVFPIGYAPGRIRHYGGMAQARRLREMRTDYYALEQGSLPHPLRLYGAARSRLGLLRRAGGALRHRNA